ncbi:DUF131 domain-containing protein [Methanonatronarchaeum sp. AMET-Sl]|uniref:TIGR00304 family membrane protein n=1 Tax=Methanonatronarchaeum sp. AMET-Sl TaxID=3037654 RepID=UPI00244E2402|nr:DUF131 domain-containing protein [Methanonatronarchaeum sp. AMET-Sl]WGI17381.1 DUF131 domain-containing protein [Methanonatronarchaeum sp. AMET-Sl]
MNLVFSLGLLLIFIGFSLLIFSVILKSISIKKREKESLDSTYKEEVGEEEVGEEEVGFGGGVVMVGPFPLVFGTDKSAIKVALIGALFLMALWLVIYFVLFWN